MKVQAVLQLQYGALWHLVACTNLVGFRLTFHLLYSKPGLKVQILSPSVTSTRLRPSFLLFVLCTWPNLTRGSLWLHFIDNDGALSHLVSGCSRNSSLSAVVDYTWAQIPALGCWPWFERVPSECNIVDGLSRKNFATAFANNWLRDSAQLPEPLLDLVPAFC